MFGDGGDCPAILRLSTFAVRFGTHQPLLKGHFDVRSVFCATIVFFFWVVCSAADEPIRTPDSAVAVLDTPNDLEATLVAAEPTLLSPSTIDVDHLGRIWVVEVVNYRRFANKNRQDREEGDRILVLQDTDGDGKVDSSHTFYQGRDIDSAHGICVLGNRIIVSALDKVLNFYDDDGDLKPDRKEVMFSGIKGAQHDHGIHSFTFGPDGRLYFNFGNAGEELHDADGQIVTDIAGHEVRANRKPYQQGMAFRCDLDGSHVETLGWNFRNNWELAVDSFGTIWQSDNDDDGNRATRINFVMEYGNYGYKDEFTGAGWRSHRTGMEATIPQQHWHLNDPGVVPNILITGAGAPCGIEVYEGNLLPKRFHDQLLHCDAGVNVVRSYAVTSDGAGYRANINPILTGERDRWFRPCDVSIAADGSLIIADWYDPGVGGHRQGDVDRGRLFRVAPPNTPWTHPEFDFSTIDGAINALLSTNRDARYQGWQALAAAGTDAEAALLAVYDQHPDPKMRARTLWLLARLEGRAEHYITLAAADENADIRIVAIRLARQLQLRLAATIRQLSADPSPAVRRACIIALCNLPPAERPALWVPLARSLPEGDRWYLEALGIAAHGIWDECGTALLATHEADPLPRAIADDILWRSRAQLTPDYITARILQLSGDGMIQPKDLARWFRALDFQSASATHNCLAALLQEGHLQQMRKDLADFVAFESLQRLNPDELADSGDATALVNETLQYVGPVRRLPLIQKFAVTARYNELVDAAIAEPGSSVSMTAIQGIVQLGQQQLLIDQLASDSLGVRQAVVTAMGNSRNAAFSPALLNLIADTDEDLAIRRVAVRSALKIGETAKELIKLTQADEIDSELRQAVAAGLHGSSDGNLRQLGQKLFPLSDARSGEKLPSVDELLKMNGNPKTGRLVFNTTGTCAKCHIVNGIGRNLGPDLSEIGSKLSRLAMFESVLFPSAGISHNYDAWTVLLANGTVLTGLKVSQTDETLVLMDNDAFKHSISTEEIDELIRQDVSLMPADLQKIMTTQELVDVVAYLESLKKAVK